MEWELCKYWPKTYTHQHSLPLPQDPLARCPDLYPSFADWKLRMGVQAMQVGGCSRSSRVGREPGHCRQLRCLLRTALLAACCPHSD